MDIDGLFVVESIKQKCYMAFKRCSIDCMEELVVYRLAKRNISIANTMHSTLCFSPIAFAMSLDSSLVNFQRILNLYHSDVKSAAIPAVWPGAPGYYRSYCHYQSLG